MIVAAKRKAAYIWCECSGYLPLVDNDRHLSVAAEAYDFYANELDRRDSKFHALSRLSGLTLKFTSGYLPELIRSHARKHRRTPWDVEI